MLSALANGLLFILSLAILVKGADFLVDGAADFARYLKVSPILVGLTIVAFGTSLPEAVIALFAVLAGSPDIAVGNVIGSNITNITLILGISALVFPLVVKSETLMYELPFMVIAAFMFALLGNNNYFIGSPSLGFEWYDGLFFLLGMIIFLKYIYTSMNGKVNKKVNGKNTQKAVKKEFSQEFQHIHSVPKNFMLILIGITMLTLGGKLFVQSSTIFAQSLGLSEAFIGLTIIALGTSLPELFTCVVAALKKHADIAVGNIVGSNVFNIFFVMGIASSVDKVTVKKSLLYNDTSVMILATIFFVLFASNGKRITRLEGAFLLSGYIVYILWLIHNQIGLF